MRFVILGAQFFENLRGTLLAICQFGSFVFQNLRGTLLVREPFMYYLTRGLGEDLGLYSLFLIPYSIFLIPYSLFSIPYSLFPIP